MTSPGIILALLVLAGIGIYTASYGVWTWKQKNRLGAIMIFLLDAAAILLPLYKLYFRE